MNEGAVGTKMVNEGRSGQGRRGDALSVVQPLSSGSLAGSLVNRW